MAQTNLRRWLQLWQQLGQQILSDKAVRLTFVAGLLLYAVLYPLPYLNQVAVSQSVVLVDLDNSGASRQLIRAVQASPGLTISGQLASEAEALTAVHQGQAAGLVLIPQGFGKQLRLGTQATVAVAADAHYFLAYGVIAESVIKASQVLSGEVRLARQLMVGQAVASGGVRLNAAPSSNLKMGYLDYMLPGLFVLILHQLLLLCGGLTTVRLLQIDGLWLHTGSGQLWSVLAAIALPPFVLAGVWYLGPLLLHYDVALLGTWLNLMGLMIPFWLATFSLSIVLGCVFQRRDSLAQLILFSAMPLLFSAGYVWPTSNLAWPWLTLWGLIPSQPMMQGMILLNQLGAPAQALQWHHLTLWGQAVGWSLLAMQLLRKRRLSRAAVLAAV
ncbi:ABC transporter permease [Ferrimonas lipolytica]|uniref:ABC transporter permease n=1 Tax=Ferrimonas lipolytica TaxID=2724191 RepID=A0A6H1UJC5_9GAMM|nr:ABC transporter permease [Ferrimonas lipolytica]QIZ77902.1 ABC transporter permease [Ferrimonas lipolytica]